MGWGGGGGGGVGVGGSGKHCEKRRKVIAAEL